MTLRTVTGVDTYPLAALGTLDPRNAMSEVLSAYLRCAKFRRGGGTVGDKVFGLERVYPWWPDPKRGIEYPSASITEDAPIPYEPQNFVPVPLERTWDAIEADTVLWKTGEAVADFTLDFWTVDDPTREAIAARIPSLFNPGEGYVGVRLAGDPRYFRAPVRATLVGSQRVDTPDSVFGRERNLACTVRCEIDVLQLRCAVPLDPRVRLTVEQP